MRVYLAGMNGRRELSIPYIPHEQAHAMKVYLAGEHTVKNGTDIANQLEKVYILESYIYVKDNKHFPLVHAATKDLLLDSGAYTFMRGRASSESFEQYTRDLADFIAKWSIKYFFELDIDQVVGLKEVERLRAILETCTGRQSIPVWHRSRGMKYWHQMCEQYPYVSISASGNNNSSEWVRSDAGEGVLAKLVEIANGYGTKVHALGYTKIAALHRIPFHSVDSTAWLMGNRSGSIYTFTGTGIQVHKKAGHRLHSKAAAQHNFNEWVKFQRYAEHNL